MNDKKKKKKTEKSNIVKLTNWQFLTLIIIPIICFSGILIFLSTSGTSKMQMFQTTGGGELDFQLMGVGIKNPYDKSEKVVVFSDNNGHAFIDGTRTTWHDDGSTHWDNFNNMNEDAVSKPAYIKLIGDGIDYIYGWEYAPKDKYSNWNNQNNWLSATGCNIDPDAVNSGVPDLGISISNIYPSDSLGKPRDDYGHFDITRKLIDGAGNEATLEIHFGFVTLQILFSITADFYRDTYTNLGNTYYESYIGETVGLFPDPQLLFTREWNTLGALLDFDAVFRIQINSLGFEDDWVLNPEWINLGNGISEIYKRGFGDIAYSNEAETEAELTESGSPIILGNYGWDIGANNIATTQAQVVPRFANEEDAMDLQLQLTEDAGTILDFQTQNPNAVYFPISNWAQLGFKGECGAYGMKAGTMEQQNLFWVQNIVVKFYTSVCAPLSGEGQEPVVILITPPTPPGPEPSLWDKLVAWFMELTGLGRAQAELVIILIIVGIVALGGIILLIGLFVAFPGLGAKVLGTLKAIGQRIGRFFAERGKQKAKARRGR